MLTLGQGCMQITLEGSQTPVAAKPGDTILASLLRAGIAFPFSCQFGTCGTCKCLLVAGEVSELPSSEHLLSAAERAAGVVLACRSVIREDDLTIRRLD